MTDTSQSRSLKSSTRPYTGDGKQENKLKLRINKAIILVNMETIARLADNTGSHGFIIFCELPS